MTNEASPQQEWLRERIGRAGIFGIYLNLQGLRSDSCWIASYVFGDPPEVHRQDLAQTQNVVRRLISSIDMPKEASQDKLADIAYNIGQGEAWERIVARVDDPMQIRETNPELYQEIEDAKQKINRVA